MTDTADKRRSTLGNSILPLTVYFSPDGSINKADRRHGGALYRGVDTITSNLFRWIPEQNSSSTYRCEQNSSNTISQEQDSALSSSVEQNTSSSYKCEQDSSIECQDQTDISED
jgi:hypothetical protein